MLCYHFNKLRHTAGLNRNWFQCAEHDVLNYGIVYPNTKQKYRKSQFGLIKNIFIIKLTRH